jgi:hypothetical protein
MGCLHSSPISIRSSIVRIDEGRCADALDPVGLPDAGLRRCPDLTER